MSALVSTPRRRRRTALISALAMVTMPLMTSSADGAVVPVTTCPTQDVPCVIVRVVETRNHVETLIRNEVIELTEDNSDLDGAELAYKVRHAPGTPAVPLKGAVINAISLDKVFEKAGAGTRGTFSEVPNSSKIPSVLAEHHFRGTFAGGLVPAVYKRSDGGTGYVRPLKTSRNDVNAGDVFARKRGAPMIITLHMTGDLLDVDVDSTPKKDITTKTAISFSATVSPKSDDLRYRWNFTGGTKAEDKTASPTHTYTKQGTYAVNLQVRGEDGSYGRAASTSVKVGKPPKPPKPSSPGGGGGGGLGGGGGGTGGGGYIPPYIPNDTPKPPKVDRPPTDDLPTMPVDDGLQEVEGFVLAGAGAEQGDSIPGAQVTAQPTEASELSTSRKISGAVIGALAVILLLGLGAEIETRWASTRLAHLRRRT